MHLIVQHNVDEKGSRTIFVIVEEDSNVSSIKAAINQKTGMSIDSMNLMYHGQILDDKSPIKDTGLTSGDTITIISNIRGGH